MLRFGLPFRSSRVRWCVALFLQLLLIALLLLMIPQTEHGQDSSPTISTQPAPDSLPSMPTSAQPNPLPNEFWSSWDLLGVNLLKQIELQTQLGQMQTASEQQTSNESALIDSAQSNLGQASNAQGQASTSIGSATESSEASLAAIKAAQADKAKTVADFENYRVDADQILRDTQGERDTERARAERNKWAAIVAGVLAALFGAATGAHAVGWW